MSNKRRIINRKGSAIHGRKKMEVYIFSMEEGNKKIISNIEIIPEIENEIERLKLETE